MRPADTSFSSTASTASGCLSAEVACKVREAGSSIASGYTVVDKELSSHVTQALSAGFVAQTQRLSSVGVCELAGAHTATELR